jgi:regulator of cell morphogenesis and NO signaling
VTIGPNSLLLDLATNAPGASRVLEDAGIDYYCAGRRTLTDGCARAGVNLDTVLLRLVTAFAATPQAQHADWGSRPVISLLARLAERHHDSERAELERLRGLLLLATRLAPDEGSALVAIENALHALETAVRVHIADTAAALFPHVMALESEVGALKLPPAAAARLVHWLRADHEEVRTHLEAIRCLTHGYETPLEAPSAVRELYAGLAAWERRAHEHAHLENNILVSRILALDPSIERDTVPVVLPVRRGEILSAGGRRQELTVFCPAQRQSLDLEWCRGCAFSRRVTEGSVECTPQVDAPERFGPGVRTGEYAAVGEAMGGHYVSVGPEVPAGVVVRAIEDEHAEAALVVDDANRLVGAIRRDGSQTACADHAVNEFAQGGPCIDEGASLADAIARMVKTHSRFLPVVGQHGRVVGLLADTDALRWVAACNRRVTDRAPRGT